jgi:hypothetical protein
MKDLLTEFDEEAPQTEATRLKEAFMFWFKKRWLYNFILLVVGWLAMYAKNSHISWMAIVDMAFWALVANLGFSLGYSLDSFFIFLRPQNKLYERLRVFLFWTGTGITVLVMLILIAVYG